VHFDGWSKDGGAPHPENSRPPSVSERATVNPSTAYRLAYAFSSQPEWPQWQVNVVMPLASSQWVEQYFLPAGATQLQAI
jgi:hypothetical protein